MLYITVFFSVASAVLFTMHSFAAPITADLSILPAAHSHYLGQIQQDSVTVPDPGIGDYFGKISSGLLEFLAKVFKKSDRDPKKIKAVKEYIKEMRTFISPVVNFVRQYYPDDVVANNVLNVVENYLSSLDKLIEEPINNVSLKDKTTLAKLMRMLEAITS